MSKRYIMSQVPMSDGCYTAIQTWSKDELPENYAWFPESLMDTFYMPGKRCAGFVIPTLNEAGDTVVSLEWNDEAYNAWLETQPKWYENAIPRKIADLSKQSKESIENGVDVQLSSGETEHFDLTSDDQANLSNMFSAMVLGATSYPYHCKDGNCKIYSKEDISKVYVTTMLYITSHNTRFNQLKQLCNSYEGKGDEYQSEFNAISYGMELTGEYLANYNTMMNEAQEQINTVLAKLTSTQVL